MAKKLPSYGTIDVPLSEKGAEQVTGACAFIVEHLRNNVSLQNQSYLKEIHETKSGDEIDVLRATFTAN